MCKYIPVLFWLYLIEMRLVSGIKFDVEMKWRKFFNCGVEENINI